MRKDPIDRREYQREYRRRNAARLSEYYRARYAENPRQRTAWARDNKLRKQYGIDGLAHWEAIFDAQGRVCASCGSPDPLYKKGWCVDHDHSNPEPNYRGIICGACNVTIGHAKECSARLRSCADYIDRHSATPNRGEANGEK